VLVVVVPLHVLGVVGTLAVAPQLFERTDDDLLTMLQDEDAGTLAALGGFWVLELAAFALALGACLAVFAGARAGDDVSARSALAQTLARSGAIVGLALVFAGVVIVGLLLWIIPGVWIATLWALALPALVLERTSVGAAITRSRELVRGRFWPILGVLALAFFGALLVSLILGGMAGAIAGAAFVDARVSGAVAAAMAGIVGNLVSVPVMAAALAVLYWDQRARKEGAPASPEPDVPEPAAFGGWQPPVPPRA
jgi:hypothetical protein